ncbi:MAG: ABC transporter permease [Spirochaetales bacterium]|nr:ABC transporter permease [Spirochaetales bacterium]
MVLSLAWRNFFRQRHRYRVLAVALVLGAVVFSLLFGVTASLNQTVREKAARYFSGDVVVLSWEPSNDHLLKAQKQIFAAIKQSGIDVSALHRRSVYYGADAQLFFNGSSLIQRRVIGMDFSVEQNDFDRMDFLSGTPVPSKSHEDVWVSDDTARRLHVKTGDLVVLMVKTVEGYSNTINLKIRGIFADSSFFGFACYMDYKVLNRALGRPIDAVTEIGATLGPGTSQEEAAERLWHALKGKVPLLPLMKTKDDIDAFTGKHPLTHKEYDVLPLTSRLKQINDLTNGITAVNLLLSLVFLIVVTIGVFNTYQMIVFERTREIGTMRAMGMQRPTLIGVFLAESAYLGLVSSVVGMLIGAGVLAILSQVTFPGNAVIDMFLVKGHLVWAWPWQNVLWVVLGMLATGFFGAVFPAWKGAQQKPVDALRHDA